MAELPAIRDELRAGLSQGREQEQNDAVDVVILLLDELLSNGLRHGHPPVIAEVRETDRSWVLEVSDHAGEAAPAPDPERDHARGGMGLLLVAGLASSYGWFAEGTRKSVWSSVPQP